MSQNSIAEIRTTFYALVNGVIDYERGNVVDAAIDELTQAREHIEKLRGTLKDILNADAGPRAELERAKVLASAALRDTAPEVET